MLIRKATTADLDVVTNIEATCFPPAEAAPREAFKERLDHYGGQFLIGFYRIGQRGKPKGCHFNL